jgi:hypothetical protein
MHFSPRLPPLLLACLILAGATEAVSIGSSGPALRLRPLPSTNGPARLKSGSLAMSLSGRNVLQLPLQAKEGKAEEQIICLGLRGGGSDSLENNLAISFKDADAFKPAGGAVHTKFICTIGPITQSVEMLTKLIEAGMNVCRMNFSHGDHEYHAQTIANVRESLKKSKRMCAIMLDTKGPEIRTGMLKGGADVELVSGQEFTLVNDWDYVGDNNMIGQSYADLASVIEVTHRAPRLALRPAVEASAQ